MGFRDSRKSRIFVPVQPPGILQERLFVLSCRIISGILWARSLDHRILDPTHVFHHP
jgi:hypothetical protein